MGYTTEFSGEISFSRDLTVREYKDLEKMNEDPDNCKDFTDTPETLPNSYLQWVSNEEGTALKWDGNEKFYDYIHWLRWLIKHYFKPRDITLNGELKWQGEELGDVGVVMVDNNKVTSRKVKLEGQVQCPDCGHQFVPENKNE